MSCPTVVSLMLLFIGLGPVEPASNGGDIEALFAPWDSTTLVIAGWRLDGITTEGECEAMLHFAHSETDMKVDAWLRVGGGPQGAGAAYLEFGAGKSYDQDLRRLDEDLTELIEGNLDRDYLGGRCAQRTGGSGGVKESGRWEFILSLAIWAVLAAIVLSCIWFLRRRRSSGTPGRRGARSLRFGVLEAVILGGLLVRASLLPFLDTHGLELESWPDDAWSGLLMMLDVNWFGLGEGTSSIDAFHTPFVEAALGPWCSLGDFFGLGGHLVWLRIPNLFFSAGFMICLASLVRRLDGVGRGVGPVAVFAFSPALCVTSLMSGHHSWELFASAWFMERLSCHLLTERQVHRSLALSAAVALWIGPITGLLIGPGLLLYLVSGLRRGQRRETLVGLLLFAGLYLPAAGRTINQVIAYWQLSLSGDVDSVTATRLEGMYGHHVYTVGKQTFRELFMPVQVLHSSLSSWLAPLIVLPLSVLALLTRFSRAVALMAVVMIFIAAPWFIHLYARNCSPLLIALLILPFIGITGLLTRLGRPQLRPLLSRVLAVVLVGLALASPLSTDFFPKIDESWLEETEMLLLEQRNVAAMFEVIDTDSGGDHRTILLPHTADHPYNICGARPTAGELGSCLDTNSHPVDGQVKEIHIDTKSYYVVSTLDSARSLIDAPQTCRRPTYVIGLRSQLSMPDDELLFRTPRFGLIRVDCGDGVGERLTNTQPDSEEWRGP